ncbi:MAG: hypothetical protein RLZZ179_3137 [Verrucomicrobiota bacterium]|jgi:hypothetical protein
MPAKHRTRKEPESPARGMTAGVLPGDRAVYPSDLRVLRTARWDKRFVIFPRVGVSLPYALTSRRNPELDLRCGQAAREGVDRRARNQGRVTGFPEDQESGRVGIDGIGS